MGSPLTFNCISEPLKNKLYYYRYRTFKYSVNPKIITYHYIRLLCKHIYGPQNLTFEKFTTERVLCWRLVLEEYGITIKHKKGPDNDSEDDFSRLPPINYDVTKG